MILLTIVPRRLMISGTLIRPVCLMIEICMYAATKMTISYTYSYRWNYQDLSLFFLNWFHIDFTDWAELWVYHKRHLD